MDETDILGRPGCQRCPGWPDDDRVVFVPAEDIRAIESIYGKMEQARRELQISLTSMGLRSM